MHRRNISPACADDFMREASATPMGTVDTMTLAVRSRSSFLLDQGHSKVSWDYWGRCASWRSTGSWVVR
jgi:hypothetical protein